MLAIGRLGPFEILVDLRQDLTDARLDSRPVDTTPPDTAPELAATGVAATALKRPEAKPTQQVIRPEAPLHGGEEVGRNDPCPCGSGKKYKKCCGAT